MAAPRRRCSPLAILALTVFAPLARAQTPAAGVPAATATVPAAASPAPPAAPGSPVSAIRNKLSAADLASAESILEVHREKYGEDGPWLAGLSWLARGALMLGERDRAGRYAALAHARAADSLAADASLARTPNAETALGAAIEVEAQLLAQSRGAAAAARLVRAELERIRGPISLRSRLWKRANLLELVGQPAPEWSADTVLGRAPATLASLRGRPLVLFLFAEWCGDCKAQAASLARARERFGSRGLELVALTRWYDEPSGRAREAARVDSVWKAVYSGLGPTPVVVSAEAMERYGGSATPTFVFVDRRGVVRAYAATRLTEEALERQMRALVD